MPMKYSGALGAISLAAATQSSTSPVPERGFLYHSNEMADLGLQFAWVRGIVDGQVFDIVLERKKEAGAPILFMSVTSKKKNLGKYAVTLGRLPKLDLASASYFGRVKPSTVVKIEVRFGDESDCFVNDDGRDRMTAVFRSGHRPEGYTISYKNCEPNVTKL